jgi:hypothetical protein
VRGKRRDGFDGGGVPDEQNERQRAPHGSLRVPAAPSSRSAESVTALARI